MDKMDTGFSILKWFIELNSEAKAVIGVLILVVISFGYSNYNLNSDIKEERLRYDILSDKYSSGSRDCSKDIDRLNALWTDKYDKYRNLREEELKSLTKAWEDRYNDINKKIERYEKRN